MSYKVNSEYLKRELVNQNSTLFQALLNYDGVLPMALYQLFNIDINPLQLPRYLCSQMNDKHGEKWIEHGRLEYYKLPGETFTECEDRLTKKLLDDTGLPIFIER